MSGQRGKSKTSEPDVMRRLHKFQALINRVLEPPSSRAMVLDELAEQEFGPTAEETVGAEPGAGRKYSEN